MEFQKQKQNSEIKEDIAEGQTSLKVKSVSRETGQVVGI